jgi:hypothetical protein
MSRTCLDCPKAICAANKGGRCKACTLEHARRDPEVQTRRLENLRAVQRTSEHRAKISRGKKASEAMHADDPARQERHRRQGQRLRAQFEATPGAEDKRKAALSAAMKIRAEKMLGWCPVEHRGKYRKLRKTYGAPEAKRRVLHALAVAEALRIASLTPLQRQIERIQAGARLVEKPSFRRPDHAFTLGGVASGML